MSKVMLIYPPCEHLYQRGEDRCQSDTSKSTSTAMRACNDLGYMATVLKEKDDKVFLKDYQTERLSLPDFIDDAKGFLPDAIVMCTTTPSIVEDMKCIHTVIEALVEKRPRVIVKGALFFGADEDVLSLECLKDADILCAAEIPFVIYELVHGGKDTLATIQGIIFKDSTGKWVKTPQVPSSRNYDEIPFPDRSLMNNALYVRPDTGEPMATITISHGCPSSCIYCLSPIISGRKIRLRSVDGVIAEMDECFNKYGIRNFFFQSDTFSFYKDWVLELCQRIKESDMAGKIEFCANSRVKPLEEETIKAMKEAGCFMIAFGFETGSEDTLQKIKKGTTFEEARQAMEWCRKYKLPVFGFFMMGFPWETWEDLQATRKFILELDPDFLEVHIALPYYGTRLYQCAAETGVLVRKPIGMGYFDAVTTGTQTILADDLEKFRNRTLLSFHLRPKYIFRKVATSITKPKVLANYVKFGIRMLKNCLK